MAYTWQLRNWWADYLGKSPEWVGFMGKEIRVAAPLVPGLVAMDIVLSHNGYADPTIVGSYFNRNIAGSTKKSTHAYGIAVDLDPYAAGNPFFKGGSWTWSQIKFTPKQVAAINAIKNTRGTAIWRWLGDVNGDTMHWQANVPPWRAEVDWSTVDGFNGEDNLVLELGKALLAQWTEAELEAMRVMGLWHGAPVTGAKYFKGSPADSDIINLAVAVLANTPTTLINIEAATPKGLSTRVDAVVASVGKIRDALRSV